MRSDFELYIVAAFFFIITIASAVMIVEAERTLWIITTAVLGMFTVGLGYSHRPKAATSAQAPPPATIPSEPMPPPPPPEPIQAPIEQKIEAPAQTVAIETPQIIQAPTQPSITEAQVTTTPIAAPAPITETEAIPNKPVMESPLTKVKGIGEKRASQLNALGINSIEELAKSSAKDLAKSLKISPKIVDKWIVGAKEKVK
jgi:predicted flap endonuclease-1-like 5' DNA nuclease